MLYAITGTDGPNSLPKRVAVRAAHLARVRQLLDEGRLVIAGPHPLLDINDPGDAGYSGSLIVAEFHNLADAETWARADPYIAGGAWIDVSVKPFVQVLP
ncbi:MAG: YciI family protein [Gammaproteobacteria bacterium]|nr:YciI family protein [Gammaproteobacteria bacterium]